MKDLYIHKLFHLVLCFFTLFCVMYQFILFVFLLIQRRVSIGPPVSYFLLIAVAMSEDCRMASNSVISGMWLQKSICWLTIFILLSFDLFYWMCKCILLFLFLMRMILLNFFPFSNIWLFTKLKVLLYFILLYFILQKGGPKFSFFLVFFFFFL